MLERFKGQFFQWFYVDGFALPKVKELFDELFAHVAQTTGEQNQATYKQWRGRHRYWNRTWRMPKKVKGSAPAAFPPQLERYQLWRLGTDELLAVGSTVASITNRNSSSLSYGENHHEQEHSAGQRQFKGIHNIESYHVPTPVFTTAPDFDRSFQERAATSWAMLSPSPEILIPSDPFDRLNEDTSSSLISQGDLPFDSAEFLPCPIADTSVPYTKMDYRSQHGWTIQDSTSRVVAPGLTLQETEETRRSQSNSRKSVHNSFSHLPPRFGRSGSEGTTEDAAFFQYSPGS